MRLLLLWLVEMMVKEANVMNRMLVEVFWRMCYWRQTSTRWRSSEMREVHYLGLVIMIGRRGTPKIT